MSQYTYKVLEPGFFNAVLHQPGNPRHDPLVTDKKLDPVPSWLKPVANEDSGKVAEKQQKHKADTDKVKTQKDDIKGASFMDNSAKGAGVETL